MIFLSSCFYASSGESHEVTEVSDSTAEDTMSIENDEITDTVKIDYIELAEKEKKNNVIIITKSSFTLALYYDTIKVKEYIVALGKNPEDKTRVGDNATPLGIFYIVKIEDSSLWTHDFNDGKGEIEGAYGPFFLRLKTGAEETLSGKEWKGIGIHGTHDNSSIGTNASEGCIRMKNQELVDLIRFVQVNTRVEIRE